MCFFHAPSIDAMTRGDALLTLAALGALPIMPSQTAAPRAAEKNAGRPYTAIIGTTALTGDDFTPIANATVLLRGNTIEAVGAASDVTIPESALRLQAPGTFTIPGLVDSHVHFFQSGGLYTRPDAVDLRSVRPYTAELQWIQDNLLDTFARYLRAGVTSVVDVGGPFWNYDVRALAQRTLVSPRVMVAGPLISSVDRAILDPHGDPPIVKIGTVQAAKALIDREIASHTDYVKFWWIVTPTHPAVAFRPVAEAAVAYAHSRGARVVIHATELETATLAVESGTDILAHSVFDTDVDDSFLQLLSSRKTIYCPTLMVVGNYGYAFAGAPNLTPVDLQFANPDIVGTLFAMPDVEDALQPDVLQGIRTLRKPDLPRAGMRNLKRVYDAGITVAAGTDAGNIGTLHASSLYNELVHMVASGLTPKQVLATATRGGAAMMGRSHDLGTLARGKIADVVVLESNPLDDIAAVAGVRYTIKDGHVFEASSILNETVEQIVQRQVNAYNYHDAAIFSRTYAVNAEVAGGAGPALRSRAEIEAAYRKRFADNPQLHAEIVDRTVDGNVVTDRERVSGFADGSELRATVAYEVRDGAIARSTIRVTA